MAKPIIEAITGETLPEFASFLAANMRHPRSAEDWASGLQTGWAAVRPNYGFVLRAEGRVVGGIGAIYAQRSIRGQTENFANITSWCVLDSHRKWSMPLAMAVIAQPGYHFTDFSPTKIVAEVLQFLNFKPLDEGVVVIPNVVASPLRGRIASTPAQISRSLSGPALQVWQDHASFPWLRHVLIGEPGNWCHVIYKRGRLKGVPSARILYRSDASIMDDYLPRLFWHFLGCGFLTTQVERRFLNRIPQVSRVLTGFNPKQYLSPTLQASDIDYLYSESVALDL